MKDISGPDDVWWPILEANQGTLSLIAIFAAFALAAIGWLYAMAVEIARRDAPLLEAIVCVQNAQRLVLMEVMKPNGYPAQLGADIEKQSRRMERIMDHAPDPLIATELQKALDEVRPGHVPLPGASREDIVHALNKWSARLEIIEISLAFDLSLLSKWRWQEARRRAGRRSKKKLAATTFGPRNLRMPRGPR